MDLETFKKLPPDQQTKIYNQVKAFKASKMQATPSPAPSPMSAPEPSDMPVYEGSNGVVIPKVKSDLQKIDLENRGQAKLNEKVTIDTTNLNKTGDLPSPVSDQLKALIKGMGGDIGTSKDIIDMQTKLESLNQNDPVKYSEGFMESFGPYIKDFMTNVPSISRDEYGEIGPIKLGGLAAKAMGPVQNLKASIGTLDPLQNYNNKLVQIVKAAAPIMGQKITSKDADAVKEMERLMSTFPKAGDSKESRNEMMNALAISLKRRLGKDVSSDLGMTSDDIRSTLMKNNEDLMKRQNELDKKIEQLMKIQTPQVAPQVR